MELVKKNIHMDRMKCRAATQVTLEEDMNIPDSKPDVAGLVFEQGKIQIEEVKPTENHVNIRGRLLFCILYQTREEGQKLVRIENSIPFEEQMYLEGAKGSDSVTVESHLEDLTVGMINSRKLSIQALLELKARVEDLYDVEAPVDLYTDNDTELPEYRKSRIELAQIAIQKNDIFRMRNEITLPQSYPNIFKILWEDVSLEEMEVKPLSENLSIQGEVHVFILYEGEGEENPIRSYETTIPINGTIECQGCRDTMLGDIQYSLGHLEMEVKPDPDGEQRVLELEMVLDLSMKMYEEEEMDVITDIYGITKEVESTFNNENLKQILRKISGKSKVSDKIRIKTPQTRVLQLLHSEGNLQIDSEEIVEEGILIKGVFSVSVLYVTADDDSPYNCAKGSTMFEYLLEVPGICKTDSFCIHESMNQPQVMMVDGEEMDVKVLLEFHAMVFRNINKNLISEVKVHELDQNKVNDLPGIVFYVAREQDNLWNIGKQYYVSVESIKEVNELSSDEIHPGDKLLIVKGMH